MTRPSIKFMGGLVMALAVAGCKTKPVSTNPIFEVRSERFEIARPQGFCRPNESMEAGFQSLYAQNADKFALITFVDCVENEKYTSARNYFTVMTLSGREDQLLPRQEWLESHKAGFDEKSFFALLDSGKTFEDLKVAGKGAEGKPFGEHDNQLPDVRDDLCIYSGGRYGPLPLTKENSSLAVSCLMSIKDRRVMIFHNAEGKNDQMEMARRVRAVAKSIKPVSDS